jgi:hypothetical protein
MTATQRDIQGDVGLHGHTPVRGQTWGSGDAKDVKQLQPGNQHTHSLHPAACGGSAVAQSNVKVKNLGVDIKALVWMEPSAEVGEGVVVLPDWPLLPSSAGSSELRNFAHSYWIGFVQLLETEQTVKTWSDGSFETTTVNSPIWDAITAKGLPFYSSGSTQVFAKEATLNWSMSDTPAGSANLVKAGGLTLTRLMKNVSFTAYIVIVKRDPKGENLEQANLAGRLGRIVVLEKLTWATNCTANFSVDKTARTWVCTDVDRSFVSPTDSQRVNDTGSAEVVRVLSVLPTFIANEKG